MATKTSKTTTAKTTAKEATQQTLKMNNNIATSTTSPAAKKEEKPAAKAVTKPEEKKTETTVVKETAKKPGRPAGSKSTTAAGKKTTRKPSVKKIMESAKTEVVVQFAGSEYSETDMMKMVVKAWEAEGKKATAIKKVKLYVKPEDGKAYYVINEGLKNGSTGAVDL